MTSTSDATKSIKTLDAHIANTPAGSAEATALAQVRYRILTDAGMNGVDDVDPPDPEAKPATKAANTALAKQIQGYIDDAPNAGQAAPFEQVMGLLDGGDDGDD